jgi:phospholipid transport system transporter-binding protein
MIRVVDQRIEVSGDVNMANAAALLADGVAAITGEGFSTTVEIDLGGLTAIDSSLLAVVFGWMRAARVKGRMLQLRNPPANLLSLATVYGVAELLPQH